MNTREGHSKSVRIMCKVAISKLWRSIWGISLLKNGHGLNTIFSAIWSSHLLSSWTPTRFQWQRCALLHLPSHFLSTGNPSTKLSLCCVVIFSWTFIVLLPPDHSQENKTWQLLSEPSRARGRRLIGPPMSSLEQGTAGQHGELVTFSEYTVSLK